MSENKTLLVIGDNPYDMIKKYGPENYTERPYIKYKYADRDRIYRNMIKAAEMMRMDEDNLDKLKGMGSDVYFSNLGVGYDCDEFGNITTFENPDMKYDFIWEDDENKFGISKTDGTSSVKKCPVSEIMFRHDDSRMRELISEGKITDEYRSMFGDDEEMVAYNTSSFATNAILGDNGWDEFDPTKQNDVSWVVKYKDKVMEQCSGDVGKTATLFFYH